jgi:hypothetical protein
MGKYTQDPIVKKLAHFCEHVQKQYRAHQQEANPRDFLETHIQELDARALIHLHGELISADVNTHLGGSWANLSPKGAARLFLKAYLWPYFCEDPLVQTKIRDSGHAGCLPVAKQPSPTGA